MFRVKAQCFVDMNQRRAYCWIKILWVSDA